MLPGVKQDPKAEQELAAVVRGWGAWPDHGARKVSVAGALGACCVCIVPSPDEASKKFQEPRSVISRELL